MFKSVLSTLLVSLLIMSCGMGGRKTAIYEGYTESGPINNYSVSDIQLRQLDVINAIRAERGAQPVLLSSELTAAAFTHARDIAAQQRAWNFGSDKSTPQLRGERAGFFGIVTGELVSESYRGELQVVQSWLDGSISRQVLTDPHATHVGIAFFMEGSGKVWWVTDFGESGASQSNSQSTSISGTELTDYAIANGYGQ